MSKNNINKLSNESMIALTQDEIEKLDKEINDFQEEVLELYNIDTKAFVSEHENI